MAADVIHRKRHSKEDASEEKRHLAGSADCRFLSDLSWRGIVGSEGDLCGLGCCCLRALGPACVRSWARSLV